MKAFRTHLKFLILNTYYPANDRMDALYTAAALGYPLDRVRVSALPKYFFINERLCYGKKKTRQIGVLIAPTHRWADVVPPLTKICASDDTLSNLFNLNIRVYYSAS